MVLGVACLTRGDMLFYVPVVLVTIWAPWRGNEAAQGHYQRLGSACVAGLALCAVVSLWTYRNWMVGGPNAGGSTAGFNAYLAHNPSGYGSNADKKPLEGLKEVERNEKAWRLARDHIAKTGISGILHSSAMGTLHLLGRPPLYAAKWSTIPRKDKRLYSVRVRLRQRMAPYILLTVFYYAILLMSVASAVRFRRASKNLLIPVLGIVASNWFFHTVVFWGKPRYRYVSEVMMCILAAGLIVTWLTERKKRARLDAPALESVGRGAFRYTPGSDACANRS